MEGETCANCGATRHGAFCARCGQNDRDYHRSFPPLLGELLRETFEIDSRVFRTLRSLLFKPGELALEFSRNRRASYVSPIRLYLFVSISFFFLLSVTTNIDEAADSVQILPSDEVVDAPAEVDDLSSVLGESRNQKLQEMLAEPEESWRRQLAMTIAAAVAEGEAADAVATFALGQLVDAAYSPGSALGALLENLPLTMFLMLPVFAFLLAVMYWRRGHFYVEHLVFATHLHTFAFLVYIVLLLLPDEPQSETTTMLVNSVNNGMPWLLAVYHLLALKRFYGGGWLGNVFAFGFQMAVYFVVLLPLSLVLVALFTVATL